MNKEHIHTEWVRYPVGAIPKGSFCGTCKRYNVRNTTVQLIPIHEGKVLLQKRNLDPEKGAWALVAGYLGWDETLEQCMERELKEEMGMTVSGMRLVGVYSDPGRDKDGRQNVAVVFAGDVAGTPRIDPYEVEEVGWFELDALPEIIAFDHRKMIEDYVATNTLESKS